ncbi:MAG: efflux RND transporter permease subunit [Alphaproteobacteria bacterium]|nr:efflux RND transporter permease subunit [Alphaproteobacteria bacterium]
MPLNTGLFGREPGGGSGRRGGLIDLFARHPTAANLLMMLMIIGGLFAINRMNTQFFPDFGIDIISVAVEWPGASAEDVDANIVQAIEPEVRFLDGVKRVRSTSVEGRGSVVVEFEPGSDMQAALADVETGVGQVMTLPDDSERPEIRRIVRYDTISRLVISGPYPERSLKAIAKRIRDGLLDRGIDKVDLSGARDEEIWVEVRPEVLRRLNMTLADIAGRIAEQSRDLPSGVTGGGSERQIRSLGLVKDAAGIGAIEIKALETGQRILLRDVARVSEAFEEKRITLRHRGQPAIGLHIQRATSADALDLANTVDDYLAEIGPTLPENLVIEQYDVMADLIRSRIQLLLKNGLGGLVLVLTVLFLFLNSRVAFWVAVGIPVSLLATMVVMLASGQSINMVSLFALIMVLGIIVDDAIVVGEHAEARFRDGMDALEAAETGARRMAAPVFSSSLTTIAAFTPLLIISDIIGQIIRGIPLVAIAVIIASLVECFLVLPGHMRSALTHEPKRPPRLRRWFDAGFQRFREGWFRNTVGFVVRWRYATLATALGAFILIIGLVAGGRLPFVFFMQPEGDRVFANIEMAAGTPREQTVAMLDELERAMRSAEAEVTGAGEGSLVKTAVGFIGGAVGVRPGRTSSAGDHVGGIFVELVAAEDRTIEADTFMSAWRAAVRRQAGLTKVTILPAEAGPPGREVDVRLLGDDINALKTTGNQVAQLLESYPGVSDIADNLPYGRRETIIEVTPRGRALGFNTQNVGRQVRNAFQGAIAKRFPRDDEEIIVRVQYPRGAIDLAALDALYLRSPTGAEVPLAEVVRTREKQGFARILREDGARQIAITAELDKEITNTGEIVAALERDGIYKMAADKGLSVRFEGKAQEQATTLADMRVGAMVGLSVIYIVLAWVFASYTRPIVVMSVIPLGLVGAALGHMALGFELTILSLVALIGLSGIVVNDSIILVTTIDERIRSGQEAISAITDGACDRLRAVMLTSLTTIGGLTPLMFERDLQAQFLIPMAVTLVFGLMVTTFLVLLVVPALLAAQEDFGALRQKLRMQRRTAEPVRG